MPTHQGVQRWVRDLNHFYKTQPCLWERDLNWEGFQWVNADDADNSTFSYMRFASDRSDFIVVVMNFTPVPRQHYRIGVPQAGYYQEVLNSDASMYGGGNVGNGGGVRSKPEAWREWQQSLDLTIPPLGLVVLKLSKDE
jgi:1,4-alpha-glucan branching enzyme